MLPSLQRGINHHPLRNLPRGPHGLICHMISPIERPLIASIGYTLESILILYSPYSNCHCFLIVIYIVGSQNYDKAYISGMFHQQTSFHQTLGSARLIQVSILNLFTAYIQLNTTSLTPFNGQQHNVIRHNSASYDIFKDTLTLLSHVVEC